MMQPDAHTPGTSSLAIPQLARRLRHRVLVS